jgi:hypothetical protein
MKNADGWKGHEEAETDVDELLKEHTGAILPKFNDFYDKLLRGTPARLNRWGVQVGTQTGVRATTSITDGYVTGLWHGSGSLGAL